MNPRKTSTNLRPAWNPHKHDKVARGYDLLRVQTRRKILQLAIQEDLKDLELTSYSLRKIRLT